MKAATSGDGQGYVDIYLLPVPRANLDAYRDQASVFGRAVREHGGLAYREFRGDDLVSGLTAADDGEELMAAVVEFTSRAHRDEVMAKVLADPRVKALQEGAQLADMERMTYGGFETFVEA